MKKLKLIIVLFCGIVSSPAFSQFTDMFDFSSTTGQRPNGNLIRIGNRLYGMTISGGAHNDGCIFCINPDGSGYKDLFDFAGANGKGPLGSLTYVNNRLYGMTEYGGIYNIGTIFRVDTDGNGYVIIHNMLGFSTDGNLPQGSLTLAGSKFYGMTSAGGQGSGDVFSIDTTGAGYKELVNFRVLVSPYGANPYGSVTVAGGKVYGMTWKGGGSHNAGCIFTVDTNGKNYKDLMNFDGVNTGNSLGSFLLLGNTLFGLTGGGLHSDGQIFSIDTNGTSFRDLHDFDQFHGTAGLGDLIFYKGVLYGNGSLGGYDNSGVLFDMDSNGSNYNVLYYCKGPTGSRGNGTPLLWGDKLYGMMWDSGAHNLGVIYSDSILCVKAAALQNVGCNGGSNAIAACHIISGTTPYTYLWAPVGATTDTVKSLSAGTYTVTVTDSLGFTASAYVTITQPSALTDTAYVTNITCLGDSTGVLHGSASGGTPPYTYLWTPGGQTTDSITGQKAGTYTLTVNDRNGCSASNTVQLKQDTVKLTITTVPDTITWVGDSALLTTNCNLAGNYVWAPSLSTGQSLYVKPLVTTTYTVECMTACGMHTDTVTVYVILCSNNYNEPICQVTIDTATNKAEVLWGRTNSPPQNGTGYYKVYRDSNSVYTLTHSQPLNVLSDYLDINSNPSAGPVSYKISTYDSCGESSLSAIHTTMFLTTTSSTNVYILNWTAYVGFTPLRYRIFRGPALNAMVQIDSVPNTILTYHDTLPPLGSYYAVEAVNPSGSCIPTTRIRPHSSAFLSGSFSNGFNTTILSTGKLASQSIQYAVYPNPNNGVFTIESSMSSAHPDNYRESVEIYNVLGEKIYKSNINSINTEINISKQPGGIYFYRVLKDDGGILGDGKLIIQK